MKEGALWRHPSSSKFWNNDSSIANSEYTGIHSSIESLNLIGREDNCPITVIGCNDLSTGSHYATVRYESIISDESSLMTLAILSRRKLQLGVELWLVER